MGSTSRSTVETAEQARRESPFVVLVVGLVMVYLLQRVAVAVLSEPGFGLAVGVGEVLLALRLPVDSGARALRWILGGFGLATLALSGLALMGAIA